MFEKTEVGGVGNEGSVRGGQYPGLGKRVFNLANRLGGSVGLDQSGLSTPRHPQLDLQAPGRYDGGSMGVGVVTTGSRVRGRSEFGSP